jgi:hypothetical protein
MVLMYNIGSKKIKAASNSDINRIAKYSEDETKN